MQKRNLAAAAMLFASVLHAQPDNRTPLEAYRGDSAGGVMLCGMKLKLALLHAERSMPPTEEERRSADYAGCIRDQSATIRQQYAKALRVVKKPAAKAALKEHFIAVSMQLQGLVPASDEIRLNYTRRQTENEARTEEKWIRFEAEN